MRQIGHVIKVTGCRLHEVQLMTGQEMGVHPFSNTKSWLLHGHMRCLLRYTLGLCWPKSSSKSITHY